MQLKDPFVFNQQVQPIKLPKAHMLVPTNSSVVLSGWGDLGGVILHFNRFEIFMKKTF